jgi:hypothetical protein
VWWRQCSRHFEICRDGGAVRASLNSPEVIAMLDVDVVDPPAAVLPNKIEQRLAQLAEII